MHESEYTFEEQVCQRFADRYGENNVQTQYRFDDDRVADLLVHAAGHIFPVTYAVEIENDGQSVLNGGGQARYYAEKAQAEFTNAAPLLVVPAGHIDSQERATIEATGVLVWEVPDES